MPNFVPFQYINLKLSTDILLCGDIDMVQMDQQTAIDFIRDQRLDMLEMLGELVENILCTLRNMTTGSGVQDLSEVMFNYRSVLNDTIQMVANLDELENKLKVSWQNKQFPCVAKRKTALLRATTKHKRA